MSYRTKNPVKDSGTNVTDAGELFGDWTGYAGFAALVGSAALVGWSIAKRVNRRGRSVLMGSNAGDMWEGW